MTLEFFKSYNPKGDALATINQANEIITEYGRQGYTLTLRQLYYQFVAKDLIPNNNAQYKRLGNIVSRGRMAGLVSWTAIEDKHRTFKGSHPTMDDVDEALENAKYFISVNHWDEQEVYLEVWVEKDALGNVIERACREYDIPHMACKGYMSTSASWEAGKRFEQAIEAGKTPYIIHLGDHDASGIDMSRDNETRINLFANAYDIELKRIALNMDQVDQYSPPPNPAKQTDPRAEAYIAEHGDISWELDALEPSVIERLINISVEELIDVDTFNRCEERQLELRNSMQVKS